MMRSQDPASTLWIISKHENGRMEVFTLSCEGGQALPVFSFREEAEMFLDHGPPDGEWRVTEGAAGHLISVLYGPCAGVDSVALDPLPQMVADGSLPLVSLKRRRFVRHVMAVSKAPARPAHGSAEAHRTTADPRAPECRREEALAWGPSNAAR